MKQIIGYMEYDIKTIKQGLGLMALIFGIISTVFIIKEQNILLGITYLLFGVIIMSGSFFTTAKSGSLSFSALLPGTLLQKVLGRTLSEILLVLCAVGYGLLISAGMKIAGMKIDGMEIQIDLSLLMMVTGVTLFFIAVQKVLLYIAGPIVGAQLIGIIRMTPGFIMFFGMMSLYREIRGGGTTGLIWFFVNHRGWAGMIVLAAGIFCQVLAVLISYRILSRRDGV